MAGGRSLVRGRTADLPAVDDGDPQPVWLTSKAFLPGIITAEDKASLLVAGLVAGLFASVFEELGWTGFATHEVSKRHGLLATGLIVGLPWCVVHLPLYLGTPVGLSRRCSTCP